MYHHTVNKATYSNLSVPSLVPCATAAGESVRLLEDATRELEPNTAFSGEAQLWLALAYQVRRAWPACMHAMHAACVDALPAVRDGAAAVCSGLRQEALLSVCAWSQDACALCTNAGRRL